MEWGSEYWMLYQAYMTAATHMLTNTLGRVTVATNISCSFVYSTRAVGEGYVHRRLNSTMSIWRQADKAAYISLAPNDERPHPDNGSVDLDINYFLK